jgi:uncharacterized protein (TIGR02145 family)
MNKVLCALAAVVLTVGCATAQTFTDKRDGKTYRTVKIGKQTWMAENLNYKTDSSWCYDNDTSNCKKYGRLYDWNAAMKACPAGWRLPDTSDWNKLVIAAGGTAGQSETGAQNLKSQSWDNGTNSLGFSALPGGYRNYPDFEPPDGGYIEPRRVDFEALGSWGCWWTATRNGKSDYASPYYRVMITDYTIVSEDVMLGFFWTSVRCLRD